MKCWVVFIHHETKNQVAASLPSKRGNNFLLLVSDIALRVEVI